jgi:hypothetical protein
MAIFGAFLPWAFSIAEPLIRAEPEVDAVVLMMTSATATQVSSKSPATRCDGYVASRGIHISGIP